MNIHYGVDIGRKTAEEKKAAEAKEAAAEDPKEGSNHVKRKFKERTRGRKLDTHLAEQFALGRLLACISSRPGQCGRCDGYILEGRELEFYTRKMQKKAKKHA
ncbi:40S ribosomal protein S8 [Monoraphidium neglectum]|uniref:40S ribosomal protein S8 n=1 Tax=Monoraphidium neglectum TaxID=145388 RepID=A0A0D2LZU2_9CHLO|nr:40S ribosomal protein S8 [Monoraphidium neglectum]KIY94861.1 40S ribosomal protein S8 [Monoraphidium neglectum]|eukprot:XP_013893881.1 40S ribosomal protein S8 [Monoraphidium neglectum]